MIQILCIPKHQITRNISCLKLSSTRPILTNITGKYACRRLSSMSYEYQDPKSSVSGTKDLSSSQLNNDDLYFNDRLTYSDTKIYSSIDMLDSATIPHTLINTIKHIPNRINEILDRASKNEKLSGDFTQANNHGGLFLRQLKIEEEQQNESVKDYHNALAGLMKMGQGTTMKQIQSMVLKWYEPLCEAIAGEMKLFAQNEPGFNRKIYGPLLFLLPIDKLSVITIDTTLSNILKSGNIGTTITSIAANIGSLIENEVSLTVLKHGKVNLQGSDLKMIQEAVKNKKYALKIHYKIKQLLNETSWPNDLKVRLGACLLSLLVSVCTLKDNQTPAFLHSIEFKRLNMKHGVLRLDSDLYNEFVSKDIQQTMPRYLPMLVQPQDWDPKKKNFGGCYYRLRTDLVRTFSRNHVEVLARASMAPVLDGLNYLGKNPWKINKNILKVVNEIWDRKLSLAEIPLQEDLPLPEKKDFFKLKKVTLPSESSPESPQQTPNSVDNIEQVEELVFDEKLFKSMIKRVGKKNSELHSLRCDFKIKLMIAEKFKDDIIYLPWNLDFRGRAYPIPQNLSHLGSDLCRGLLLFGKGKPLGNIGLRWLKIHLANLFGNNKITLDKRAEWADQNIDKIYDCAINPIDGTKWWAEADEPFQFLATCMELRNAIESGNPETYISYLPVHQDGSCNGLQHYAALGRDAIGGKAVNLLPNESGPQDVYSRVLDIVLVKIDRDCNLYDELMARGPPDETQLASELHSKSNEYILKPQTVELYEKNIKKLKQAKFVKGLVNRKVIKQTVMTSVYGVTQIGARAQVQARFHDIFMSDPSQISTPELEKQLYDAAGYVSSLTLESLSEMFSSAQAIKSWLATSAKLVAQQGHAMSWLTPLGLPVMQPYRRSTSQTISGALQNITLASNSDDLPVSKNKQGSAFSPNFVHSLDATHMLMTSLKMKERNLTFTAVHDSYWTHACDVPVLSELLRDCFIELYEKPVLENLNESLKMRFPDVNFPPLPDRGTLDITKVKESKYFFH